MESENIKELRRKREQAYFELKRIDEEIETAKMAAQSAALESILQQIRDNHFTPREIAAAMGYNLGEPLRQKRGKPKTPGNPKAIKPKLFRDPVTGDECAMVGTWRDWVKKRLDTGLSFEELVIDKSKALDLKAKYEQR